MQEQQIISYIQQCFQQGYTEATIRSQFMASGWSQEAIDQAFQSFHAAAGATAPGSFAIQPSLGSTPSQARAKKSYRKWLIAAGAVLILGAIVLVVHIVLSPKTLDKLAQPALSKNAQNTARQTDANMIASAVANYISSNSGNPPQTAGVGATANTLDLCGQSCVDANKATTTLSYYKPSAVQYHAYASSLTVPDAHTVYIVNGATCKDTNKGIGEQAASSRAVVVLYGLQTSSSVEQHCVSP